MYLRAFNLSEQINYDKNDIEVKTIIEDGEKKILLFAISKNLELSKHLSPVDAVIFVIEGEIYFKTDGDKVFPIKKGEMFILPANLYHSVKAIKDTKFTVSRI